MSEMQRVDKFRFLCYRGIECFNECCRNLSIALTPYDVFRIRTGLGMGSSEFLKKYTTWHIGLATGLPVVVFKSNNCPFVTSEGCSIYRDRPTACRLYPLARVKAGDVEEYFLIREEFCLGHEEDRLWTVDEWLRDQEVEIYNRMNDIFYEVISAKLSSSIELSKKEVENVYVACFDIDKFELKSSGERKLLDGMRWAVNFINSLQE